jgi:ATP-dependent Clp protease ATP-binding subunit ClpC
MATLHVRNVPDDLYELLRLRAAANDRSIGAETIQLLCELLPAAAAPAPATIYRRRGAQPTGSLGRFTAEARQAVVTAQAEARALGHGHVATEHLLLGVLAQDVPVTRALRGLGLALDDVRARLVPGDEHPGGEIPFHPESKRALEIALRESTKLRHTVIAPVHIVLGIAGAAGSLGAEILRGAEADEAKLRRRLVGPQAPTRPTADWIGPPPFADTSFRVVPLEGAAADWEAQLNDAAAVGYELVDIVDGRAIFKR